MAQLRALVKQAWDWLAEASPVQGWSRAQAGSTAAASCHAPPCCAPAATSRARTSPSSPRHATGLMVEQLWTLQQHQA